MASWSAQKATKAYLQALKMVRRGKEPGEVEFLAALAAGNNAQLMVMASAGSGGPAALALLCASQQTGGRVVCIFSSAEALAESRKALGRYASSVELVVGDAWELLADDYKAADFVVVDCQLNSNRERVVFPVGEGGGRGGVVVVEYDALHSGGGRWWRKGLGAQCLPVGEGLVVGGMSGVDQKKKKGWVFEVDEFTGEQHFYKIDSSYIRK